MDEFTNMAQQYSLKWNNHQPNFISMFAILRNTQALVDVTLAAEGRHLHAHKTVLSACSPYFHSLFVENPSQHPIVILKDVTFADLRTIVDFMYYGEVNITQEELPQMLHSAKSLKVKGLTETEPTSVMRSQSSEFPYEQSGEASGEQSGEPRGDVTGDQTREPSNESTNEQPHDIEPQRRQTPSPNGSPAAKRRRCRRSSNISTSINMVGEENREDSTLEIVREDITLSSVTPRRREFSHEDNTQQNSEPQNINIDDLNVNPNTTGMPQDLMATLRLRRSKHLTRQSHVVGRAAPRQSSEPTAPPPPTSTPHPTLRKHHSYPQLAAMMRRQQQQQEVGSLLIRAVPMVDRQQGGSGGASGAGASNASSPSTDRATPRASHTPAVRSGPPLSCNFCWNTVDESGRILRRKTQYHCPECRTNLCIVPCFHEYHDAEAELASVR